MTGNCLLDNFCMPWEDYIVGILLSGELYTWDHFNIEFATLDDVRSPP